MWYNIVGGCMKICVSKESVGAVKQDGNEYIYLFDKEPLEYLLGLRMHCIHYTKCNYADINLTDYDIECLKKAKITDKDYDKPPQKKNFKFGIIIPNYNYEHTIRKCLNSILKQTYNNYQIVLVDDMSTDNSLKIEREFANTYPRITLVELKQKRLNGGARNEGYLHLDDDVDYVYYVDSDDWLANDEVLELINDSLQTEPDVLFVGMNRNKDGKETPCYLPLYRNKYEAFEGWSGSCGKVIKKLLATRQECLYPEGTLKEDRTQHRRICFYMNSFKCLKKAVYVWNCDNQKSITTIRNPVDWGTSTIRHYADTLQFALSVKGQDNMIDRLMQKAISKTKEEVLNGKDRQW